jgi:hypothetical protein
VVFCKNKVEGVVFSVSGWVDSVGRIVGGCGVSDAVCLSTLDLADAVKVP